MADASRVLLGLGGCVDYELKLTAEVLENLITEYGISAAELTPPPAPAGGSPSRPPASPAAGPAAGSVGGERDLVVSILGYVARGGGGEHFVASAPALSAFANRFPHRETLGGTSVRAGILMSRLGVPSTMHLVSVNDTFRRLLPADTVYINSGVEDTFYPHLIVQYDAGLHLDVDDIQMVAPSANRLIYVNDPANGDMLLTDDLGTRLHDASVFLISGLNAMRDKDALDHRLAALREHMRELPAGAVTYFEDAAYHEPAFSRRVRDALLDAIDVYGLNEDEMQSYLGRTVDLLSADAVADALAELRELIPVPTLVLHTKYWALAAGSRAAGYGAALETGVLMAAVRYQHGDDFTHPDVESMRKHPQRPEAVAFAAALSALMGDQVRCVPGFALDIANPTTVGLGDTFVGGFLAAVALSLEAR